MKKAILALALFAGLNTAVSAQQVQKQAHNKEQRAKMTPEQRAERHAGRLQKALGLTDAQKQAIIESDVQTAKQIQPLKEEQKDRREKLVAMQKQRDEKMKSILTPEQYAKFQEMKKERMAKMAQHRAERKGERQNFQKREAQPAEVK